MVGWAADLITVGEELALTPTFADARPAPADPRPDSENS